MTKKPTNARLEKNKEQEAQDLRDSIELQKTALDREQYLWGLDELMITKELEYGYEVDKEFKAFKHWLDPEYIEAKKKRVQANYEDQKNRRLGQRQHLIEKVNQMEEELSKMEGDKNE